MYFAQLYNIVVINHEKKTSCLERHTRSQNKKDALLFGSYKRNILHIINIHMYSTYMLEYIRIWDDGG